MPAFLLNGWKGSETKMEKAFAYICAAQDAAPRLLRRYCHKVYEYLNRWAHMILRAFLFVDKNFHKVSSLQYCSLMDSISAMTRASLIQ